MDFQSGVVNQRQAIDVAPDPVSPLLIQRKRDVLFEAQGLSLVKGKVSTVVIRNTFFPQTAVILRVVVLSRNLNRPVPVLLPDLMIKGEKIFQRMKTRHFHVPVDLLQDIVDPRTHEGFDPLGVGLDLINIDKLVLMRAGLVRPKLRVGVSRHSTSPSRLKNAHLRRFPCLSVDRQGLRRSRTSCNMTTKAFGGLVPPVAGGIFEQPGKNGFFSKLLRPSQGCSARHDRGKISSIFNKKNPFCQKSRRLPQFRPWRSHSSHPI